MCWNWQVSLGSFIFISLVAKKLYERNQIYDRFTAIVFFAGGFMQLLEFGMWKSINNKFINRLMCIIAAFVILLHPIAIYFGIKKDKLDKLIYISKKYKLDLNKSVYIGNDINDYEAMMNCKIKICPKDSHRKIISISDHILDKKGGEGFKPRCSPAKPEKEEEFTCYSDEGLGKMKDLSKQKD